VPGMTPAKPSASARTRASGSVRPSPTETTAGRNSTHNSRRPWTDSNYMKARGEPCRKASATRQARWPRRHISGGRSAEALDKVSRWEVSGNSDCRVLRPFPIGPLYVMLYVSHDESLGSDLRYEFKRSNAFCCGEEIKSQAQRVIARLVPEARKR